MAAPQDPPHGGQGGGRLWARRIGWLVLIWAGSVAALGVAAMLLRWIMRAAGFHS